MSLNKSKTDLMAATQAPGRIILSRTFKIEGPYIPNQAYLYHMLTQYLPEAAIPHLKVTELSCVTISNEEEENK